MPSASAVLFFEGRKRARLLVRAARVTGVDKATALHAALAMLVAAWEGYLERLVLEAQGEVSDAANRGLSGVLALLKTLSESEIKRFNTPNADNARRLLSAYTGYDPINDWSWPNGNLNAIQTRQRLDEVLRVRHSFAHGAAIPGNISWARNRNRLGELTSRALWSTDSLLSHLVRATDAGMATHLNSVYGVSLKW
jgi:hypothetical protein